jgi:hypothetical protein
MNQIDSLRVFFTLPISIDRPPYLQWHIDRQSKQYIQRLIEDKITDAEVAAIAQLLVRQLLQPDPERLDLDSRNSIAALLANLLLSRRQQRTHADIASIFLLVKQHGSTITLDEVYALGLNILCQPERFLKNFEPQSKDWLGSLSAYIPNKFKGDLVDRLRSILGQDFNRTNLGVLARCSPTRMRTALIEAGESGTRLAEMLDVHQCLKETVAAKLFETRNPQIVHYEALLTRYREWVDRENNFIPDVNSLRNMLDLMGNITRSYERSLTDPIDRADSLDRPVGNDLDSSTSTLGDLYVDLAADFSGIETTSKRQELRQRIAHLLSDSIDPLLMLVDGLNLSQAEAGKELGCNQATALRRRKRLLVKLARQLALEVLPTTEVFTAKQLEEIASYVADCIKEYYQELLMGIVMNIEATSAEDNTIVTRFIEIIAERWQFDFISDGAGMSKAREFVFWVLSIIIRSKD